jgi:hypothetical protein
MSEKLNQNHNFNETKLEIKDLESISPELATISTKLTTILKDFRNKDNEIGDDGLIFFSLSDQFNNRKIINVS